MKLNFLLTLLILSVAMAPLLLRLPQVNKALSRSSDPAVAVTQRGNSLDAMTDPQHPNYTCVSCDLRGKDFSNQDLSRANFFGSDLRGANFSNSLLINTVFREAKLDEADLSYTNMRGADLEEASLVRANLRNAKILQGTLEYSNLERADLTNAEL